MKQLMERVMSELTDHKAEADLIYSSAKSLKLSAQKGAIAEYKVSSSQILGLRVIKEGRVGLSYTESLDDESLSWMIKQALQNAETTEPNDFERILDLTDHISDESSYTEKPVALEEKTKLALFLESGPKEKDQRVTAVPYNSFSESESYSYYLSSRGRSTSYSDKVYGITSSALMDENGKKAMFYDYQSTHRYLELKAEEVVESAVFHAAHILKERPIPTGRYQVMFDPDNLKELIECFSNFYSAKAAIDKVNPWGSKVGEDVISKDLTIIDDPLYKDAFRATTFDSEGVEAKTLTLIENGRLKSLLHNSATASKMGTVTTGHAYRSPGGPLGISGTHLIIKGKNVISLPPRFLEVIQMDGLHSGANRVSGNFSVGVKGYIWENGERAGTFGNVTLSGNLIELLKNVSVAGTELQSSTSRSFFSVPLVFHEVSIAGI